MREQMKVQKKKTMIVEKEVRKKKTIKEGKKWKSKYKKKKTKNDRLTRNIFGKKGNERKET